MNVTSTTIATNQQHLATMRAIMSVIAGKLSKSNVSPAGSGATNYGKVVNGTVLSRDTNGLCHPCGCIELADSVEAGNDLVLEDARNFFVGDIVTLVALTAADVVIAAGDNPSDLTVKARVSGISYDQVVGTVPKDLTHSFDAATGVIQISAAVPVDAVSVVAGALGSAVALTPVRAFNIILADPGAEGVLSAAWDPLTGANGTLTVTLANSAAPAITTTTQDLCDFLLAEFDWLVSGAVAASGADVCVAVSTTAVAFAGSTTTTTVGDVAGLLEGTYGRYIESATAETAADLVVDVGPTSLIGPYEFIADSVNVTAVDLDTNTVTISGSAVDADTNCLLVKDGAYKPRGVLDGTKSTVRYVDLTEVTEDKLCDVRYEGDLRTSQIVGAGAFLRRCMTGDAYPDVLNGGIEVQPEHAGFVFRSV